MTGNQRAAAHRPTGMKRALLAVLVTVTLSAACGAARTSTTTAGLAKLPVAGASGGRETGASSAMTADARAPYPNGFGTVEYKLAGSLKPLPDKAAAYELTVGSPPNGRARLASALAIAETDRHLFVSGDGSWSYDAGCEAPPDMDVRGSDGPDHSVGFACASAVMSAPAVMQDCPANADCVAQKPPEPVRPADLPSKEAATARVQTLFTAIGVDVADQDLHVNDGITQWYASAEPTVGGMPTIGRAFSVAIGPKGAIASAHGFLGTPKKIGDYPLVDATTVGFKRLQEEEVRRPRPMMGMPALCRADVPDCGRPATPLVVTITGVHLALQQLAQKLVPVFVFETGPDETTAPVPAVIDSLLEKPAAAEVPTPEPAPGKPEPTPGVGGGGVQPTKPAQP